MIRAKWLLLLALATFAMQACPARGEETESFTRGEVLSHRISVCVDKADAVEIVKADAVGGFEAGVAVWLVKDKCQTIEVVGGPIVGRVVFSAPAERGGETKTMSVVEILGGDGAVLAYFITSLPVEEKAAPKGDPKSLRNSSWRSM